MFAFILLQNTLSKVEFLFHTVYYRLKLPKLKEMCMRLSLMKELQ